MQGHNSQAYIANAAAHVVMPGEYSYRCMHACLCFNTLFAIHLSLVMYA